MRNSPNQNSKELQILTRRQPQEIRKRVMTSLSAPPRHAMSYRRIKNHPSAWPIHFPGDSKCPSLHGNSTEYLVHKPASVLYAQEAADVIAHILSLRERR
jgi:hypothetical protein